MSARRILTIGLELASPDTECESFWSKPSLLDWDIVLFKPQISNFDFIDIHGERKASCDHWRREIQQAMETGKTVIVFLPSPNESRGESNYQAIPVNLSPVISIGSSMKLSARCADILSPYWTEFESVSQYKVILTDPKVPACIVTRTGEKTVGALYRSKSSAGTLLLLPDVDFKPDNFSKEREGEQYWTPAAKKFAGRMVSTVVALDKALRSSSEVTPEPVWAIEPRFELGMESSLRVRLLKAERKVEEAQKQKEKIVEELRSAGTCRRLLFEKGKPLENVIIEALRLLGFTAAPFKESDSEFDVVFESEEGRLIGEAEGKDNKAINIDKLRQLSMNIQEDWQRESVTAPAKPVLFGNGFRLQPLSERSDPFTEKCHKAATTFSTALVFTPDLFWPVQYLVSNPDVEYARACRQTLLSSTGRVVFPSPPVAEKTQDET